MGLINRCPHVNLQGIYGDDIHCVGGYRLYCDDCGRYLDGPVSLAQALAEETWEYAVQVKIGAKWLFLGRGAGGHSFAKNAFWFEKKEKAQGYQLIRQETAPTRLVRRRISPPEVISE